MTFKENDQLTGVKEKNQQGIGPLVRKTLLMWARSGPSGILFLARAALRVHKANRRRELMEKELRTHIPTVMAISPTLKCNYNCLGCYSRSRPEEEEMTTAELYKLISEAQSYGFLSVLITGGEPFLRSDIPGLISAHQDLMFVVISNGTMITEEMAHRLAASRNCIVLISVEGFAEQTNQRRGKGAYETAEKAIRTLRRASVPVGFSVTNHAENSACLGSEAFIDQMISLGCVAGLYSEYVPCGPDLHPEWILTEEERAVFHNRVQYLRHEKPIVLVQFPQDEYGELNHCTAAGQASLHINPQGGIEPCPFVPVSVENVREKGLIEAIRSPFFQSILSKPYLLKRNKYACSLYEHISDIKIMADELR